jgi:G3E family GTPase
MKTTIVCGLLGAGKTTFIQHIVHNISEKVVVLVNDFGKAGIDGEILSAAGIESIELPSGCVCCTLKVDLITTIRKIMEDYAPDHLLIEPSGVASPSGVLEALDMLKISPVTVIGIVDATEFLELHEAKIYGDFFEDQVMNSEIILVNKTDLVEEEEIMETISLLESINPGALIFRTVNTVLNETLPPVSHSRGISVKHGTHLNFDTVSMRLDRPLRYSSFKTFFGEIANGLFGNVVRAKALVQTDNGPFRFDFSYGKTESKPFQKAIVDSRLVIIGENLKEDAVKSEALACRFSLKNDQYSH